MKTKLYLINILFLLSLFIVYSLPAIGLSEEKYDLILAKLEKAKVVQVKTEEENEEQKEKNKTNSLNFVHDQLPNLNGIWKVTKKTNKRLINPVLSKPITFMHCISNIPFEKRDFEEKQVVISLTSPNSFSVRALYPVTDDIYHDPNQDKDFIYQNFGFKAVIRPEDITYAYTIKLKDHIENRTLARQLWLNGKLKAEHISHSKITAKGYEIEYTPACHGFLIDEITFEFEKERNISGAGEGIVAMSFLIEQAANAAEPGVPDENQPMNLDSAKEKVPFEPDKNYKPLDKPGSKVPGLW